MNKQEYTLDIYVGKEEFRDSMLLESGTIVAELKTPDYNCIIKVAGEVRVVYKNTAYRSFESFPEELKELFRKGKAYNNKDVFIDDNNWFELFIDNNDDTWTGWSEVVDGLDDFGALEFFSLFDENIKAYESSKQ